MKMFSILPLLLASRSAFASSTHFRASKQQGQDKPSNSHRHLLPSTIGKVKALVVRVTDSKGREPTVSLEKLKNDIFDDDVSLKTQMEACSYGKLEIEPFIGRSPNGRHYIENGIVDIQMDHDIQSGVSAEEAKKAAKEKLGGNLNEFDIVMFCYPPGIPKFTASADANKFSYYNNEWCGYVSAQMHEVGHNLGLGHSGSYEGDENGKEYGDEIGFMGYSKNKDDQRKCYNPQKSFQLRWYEDKVDTIDPLDGVGSREFTLNGVSDYKKNNDALVVLRLEQSDKDQDYYVGFNRAEGINKDTEDKDMVTIVRKENGGPYENGQSMKVASLKPGERHVIENFNGDNRNVQIVFSGLLKGDAKILVVDNDDPIDEPPGNCQSFTIELTTDRYPKDNYWFIAETDGIGHIAALSQVYTQKAHPHTETICLPMGTNPKSYKFTIIDAYGDGLCCQQGRGSYKIVNDEGEVIVDSGGNNDSFTVKSHLLEVRASSEGPPMPKPTQAPNRPPTAMPVPDPPCEEYTVEVQTDRYPQDYSWKFVSFQDEDVAAESAEKYDKKETLYTKTVCLPGGKAYEFRFLDAEGDGICCKSGDGFYRVLDGFGKVIVDSFKKDEGFYLNIHTLDSIDVDPPKPNQSPDECEDEKKEKEKFKRKGNGRGKTCKFYAKKKKCDKKILTGMDQDKYIWQVCENSCDRCGR